MGVGTEPPLAAPTRGDGAGRNRVMRPAGSSVGPQRCPHKTPCAARGATLHRPRTPHHDEAQAPLGRGQDAPVRDVAYGACGSLSATVEEASAPATSSERPGSLRVTGAGADHAPAPTSPASLSASSGAGASAGHATRSVVAGRRPGPWLLRGSRQVGRTR